MRARAAPAARAAACTVYASDQAHSSIDKAAIVLGIGQDNVSAAIASDEAFRMSVPALARGRSPRDLAAGRRPWRWWPTVGTTSTTSVDPVPEIAALCARARHLAPRRRRLRRRGRRLPRAAGPLFAGCERADSLVVNPHKWLFTPVDCSRALRARPGAPQVAPSRWSPEYLQTDEDPG